MAAARILSVREEGVQLSIDDFGTGYSSLSDLQRLHYDGLKIDRSFVRSLSNGGEDRPLIEMILALAGRWASALLPRASRPKTRPTRCASSSAPTARGSGSASRSRPESPSS